MAQGQDQDQVGVLLDREGQDQVGVLLVREGHPVHSQDQEALLVAFLMTCALPCLPASTSYAVVGFCKIALVVLLGLPGHLGLLGLPVVLLDHLGHFPFPLDLLAVLLVPLGHLVPVVRPEVQDLVVPLEVPGQVVPEVQDQVLFSVIPCIGIVSFLDQQYKEKRKQECSFFSA